MHLQHKSRQAPKGRDPQLKSRSQAKYRTWASSRPLLTVASIRERGGEMCSVSFPIPPAFTPSHSVAQRRVPGKWRQGQRGSRPPAPRDPSSIAPSHRGLCMASGHSAVLFNWVYGFPCRKEKLKTDYKSKWKLGKMHTKDWGERDE